MGGEISVESEVGKGTTFTVNLPITNKAIFSSAVRQFGSSAILAETGQLPPVEQDRRAGELKTDELQNLLIIEDNPDVVEYLTACLQDSYALDFAYNGRSGIEKALETIPDLIVSDVMMPEKDGFEVTDTLKNDERTSHIPIVLLTAKADIQSRLDGLRRGADAYISKPFHQEELELTLANLLEMRKKMQAKFASWQLAGGSQRLTTEVSQPNDEVNLDDAFLKKAISHLEKHLDDASYSIPQLSRAMGLSQSQLYRKIKALTDLSTVAFIRRFRLHKGKHLLETTDLTISEVAYEVGFSTPSYFSDAFFEEFGLRPNAMRN
jgi:CheY-like chemotaxis protein